MLHKAFVYTILIVILIPSLLILKAIWAWNPTLPTEHTAVVTSDVVVRAGECINCGTRSSTQTLHNIADVKIDIGYGRTVSARMKIPATKERGDSFQVYLKDGRVTYHKPPPSEEDGIKIVATLFCSAITLTIIAFVINIAYTAEALPKWLIKLMNHFH